MNERIKHNALLTALLAALAIAAFAGNSLFARAALGEGDIDAASYSLIRLFSGALVLLPFAATRPSAADLPGALALAVYVAGFSYAYLELETGLGALILFGFVQITVIAGGMLKGERLSLFGWAGLLTAIGGLFVILAPWQDLGGASKNAGGAPFVSSALMAAAGIAWGIYTLIGRTPGLRAGGASGTTARNFLLASIMAAPLLFFVSDLPAPKGALLAAVSGSVTSGLGYVLWYKAAPRLGLATAASVQLATPVAAALGGLVLLSEAISLQVIVGGGLIMCGVLLTLRKV
jgi:drug/metabolite transporter (DMT)-like permease